MKLIYHAWMVPLFPLISSILIGLGLFFFPKATKNLRRIYAIISISLLGTAMFIPPHLSWQQINGNPIYRYLWSWIHNKNVTLEVGYLIDPLTPIMSVPITTIGVMVTIHSDSYMPHDQGYLRFFAYPSLSNAPMPGLVLSPNLIQIHIFRELVGMCSYSLIGFRFTRPNAANARQKASITNRVGDSGSSLGISGSYRITGSFEFEDLSELFNKLLANHEVSLFFATFCALSPFPGSVAKSAQSPLHVWLPDAMEGPTPISAPIHAATMVAAGIFLVARMFPLFKALPLMMSLISRIGGITALLGATIALAQKDLKRVLAYSTMSQLGYIMLAPGIGSYRAALFHLITHAYSKALSFPGSGSVIHSMEPIVGYCPDKSQNMAFMGGLRKYMPITGTTFLLGTLSPCGIPPFACFRSKDEILADSRLYFPILGWMAWFIAGLTGFYMFRMYFPTPEGDFRANPSNKHSISPSVSIWEENQTIKSGKGMDFALSFVKNKKGSKELELFNPLENIEESGEKEMENPVSTHYSQKEYPLYPKESNNIMLFPLLVPTIPTLFIGFIGVPFYKEKMGFDLLSYWLDPSLSYSHKMDSEEFWINATTSVGTAFLGIFIALILYGPLFLSRNLQEETDPQSEGILGYFPSSLYNWSYSRGYIDGYYNTVFV